MRCGWIRVRKQIREGIMKKFFATALVVGFVVSASFIRSQDAPSPAVSTTASPDSTPPDIPLDQQPTKEQVAKLFEAMHVREQMESMMKMFPSMIQQQVRQQEKELTANQPASARMTPEQQAALDRVMSRFLDKALTLFTVDEMLDDMAAIYQRHFTRDDVNAYIAFYSTPAGQHLLQITPVIMKEYMPVVMQRVQERSKDLTTELSKEITDVLKSSVPDATAPPAPAP
jgi:hypothetical protein